MTPRSRAAHPRAIRQGLVKHFPIPRRRLFSQAAGRARGRRRRSRRSPGETVGLVGESGCGKSTLARLIARIQRPDAGLIRSRATTSPSPRQREIRPLRRRMQMIFQDPYASLNPRMTVAEILAEPLRFHGLTADEPATLRARVDELLSLVGLSSGRARRNTRTSSPAASASASRSRARLAVSPEFIVADEPISSLDVNIQAQIINLLIDLQEQLEPHLPLHRARSRGGTPHLRPHRRALSRQA